MTLLANLPRIFDERPWAAHLYVTERCNLDCHYCNEYDNSLPHPDLDDLRRWMDKIRALGVVRLGLQGGEPLMYPDLAAVVRHARQLGFAPISMSSNGFLLTEELLAELEDAGLDSLQISVDRVRPLESTRKALKTVLGKLGWFDGSGVRLNVSGVLFRDTLDEADELLDACLERGIRVHMRVVHDDLVFGNKHRDEAAAGRLLRYIEKQERLKRAGQPIHTSWNILRFQRSMLEDRPVDWTCVAGHKYFFVSSRGEFWLCSQVRTDRHIMDVEPADLLSYRGPKSCQDVCGVYCTIGASLMVNRPLRFIAREADGAVSARVGRLLPGPRRARNL